ncbi:MAG TPA: class I SAM-dependent methyltransferase [Anaerolineales bacterium]|nr:class I SAM-dependent methyltransferase [Anaerolineales bacterium]
MAANVPPADIRRKQSIRFLPALRFGWLTPLYDPVLRWLMQEATFKRELLRQAALEPGMRILDLGCGTGTLTLLAKQTYPDTEWVGIDPDPEILARARAKAERAHVSITWDEGSATDLPYSDGSFDRVISSLVLHHLGRPRRRQALREAQRVLRPGGEFHVVDFGPPRTLAMRVLAALLRPLEEGADHFDGLLPAQIEEAGFTSVLQTGRFDTALGPLVILRAVRPRGQW